MWLFGYGSLIWRPDLPFRERRAARVTGWARRFWQASWDHRGTPDSPGRVVTLVASPGATLWGMAYAIAADDWPGVLAVLEHREQAGYQRLSLTAGLTAGERAGDVVDHVTAEVFVGGEDRPEFIGPEPLAATAAIVRRSHGPSGANVDYVLALERALAELGVRDPDVEALADAVRPGALTPGAR
ncbi:MAG: gamma-glutamylcyclotransferase [Deltaproteobacteria bacterium]|nr:gamma-glutamylcyclotransferase [Kofleriaceae bacterium]